MIKCGLRPKAASPSGRRAYGAPSRRASERQRAIRHVSEERVTIVIRYPFPPPASPYIAAMRPRDLLRPRPEGLYCPPGDFYIDPVRPVPRALVTHGHSDHARAGHGSVLATRQTLDIMALRYGDDFAGSTQEAELGETIDVNGVTVTFHPAGHVLGSAQIARRAWRHAHRRVGRLQAAPDADLPALRADPLRRVHHRGDVRPAGLPPSARHRRDRAG